MLSPGQRLASGVGLDGSVLDLRVIAAASVVPSTLRSGVIVDRRYAELAAGENFPDASQEVWLTPGAQGIIESTAESGRGPVAVGPQRGHGRGAFARQGPALASVLFLADAAAAAVLAAGAAILGLYLSARRRRYEYAALSASGVHRDPAPGRAQRDGPGARVRCPHRYRPPAWPRRCWRCAPCLSS